MYRKVLLAYDGSIEGRRALREGAKLAQLCRAEVFLLAVVELPSVVVPDAGLAIPIGNKRKITKPPLRKGGASQGVGFFTYRKIGNRRSGQKIADVAEEIGAQLVVVGHRPRGPLARWWFGSVGSYLVKRLRCSVLVGQTEISDDELDQLKQLGGEIPTADPASQHRLA